MPSPDTRTAAQKRAHRAFSRPFEGAVTAADLPVGWYRGRLVSRGAWVAVSVGLPCPLYASDTHVPVAGAAPPEQWGAPEDRWRGRCYSINGQPATEQQVSALARTCRPISAEHSRFLLADRAWAAKHAPASPEANPERPVDLSKAPPAI